MGKGSIIIIIIMSLRGFGVSHEKARNVPGPGSRLLLPHQTLNFIPIS